MDIENCHVGRTKNFTTKQWILEIQSEFKMTDTAISSKIWNLSNILHDDGVSYGDYLEQVTYLLFLQIR
ncbi:MAG: hypothetical protein WD577_03900 [Bacteroidales bacterium]